MTTKQPSGLSWRAIQWIIGITIAIVLPAIGGITSYALVRAAVNQNSQSIATLVNRLDAQEANIRVLQINDAASVGTPAVMSKLQQDITDIKTDLAAIKARLELDKESRHANPR